MSREDVLREIRSLSTAPASSAEELLECAKLPQYADAANLLQRAINSHGFTPIRPPAGSILPPY